jgi:hypothetical protein
MSEREMNEEEECVAIEAALRGLTPTRSGIERDRLMFLAGRASAFRPYLNCRRSLLWPIHRVVRGNRRRETPPTVRWAVWPCVTAASLLMAVAFAVLWAVGRTPQPAAGLAQKAPLPAIEIPDDIAPPSPLGNRRLCQLIIEKGIDALPRPDVSPRCGKPLPPRKDSYFDLLKELNEG